MKNIATPQPFDDFLRRAFFYNSSRTLFRNFDKFDTCSFGFSIP